MAALVSLDGLVPLSPDFLQKVQDTLSVKGKSAFADHAVFRVISNAIPDGGFIDFSDDALDVVAAFLDKTTNYFQHTGTQSVARKLIQSAAEEA